MLGSIIKIALLAFSNYRRKRKMKKQNKPVADLATLSEQILRLRLDIASDLLNSILDCCSGVRLEEEEPPSVDLSSAWPTDLQSGDDSVRRDDLEESEGGECGDGEAVFKRLAGWKKSTRVLEEAIFAPFWRSSGSAGNFLKSKIN